MTKQATPKQLTKAALEAIMNDTKLYSTICDLLDIRPATLMTHINRNSVRLSQYVVVMAIAEVMGVAPNDILEEKELAKVG